MRTARRILAGLLLSLTAFAGLAAHALPAHADSGSDEAEFLSRVNSLRASKGVAPLGVDGQLVDIARSWSAHMAADGAISHNPNLANQVSNWQKIGENVGVGADADSIENAFEQSPHHYANLVDPAFTLIGIGVVEANGSVWVTQDFKRPQTAAAPAPAPRPAAPRPAAQPAPRPVSVPRPAPTPRPVAASAPTPVTTPTTAPASSPPSTTALAPTPTVLGSVHPRMPAEAAAWGHTAVPVALVLFALAAIAVARRHRTSPVRLRVGARPVTGSVA